MMHTHTGTPRSSWSMISCWENIGQRWEYLCWTALDILVAAEVQNDPFVRDKSAGPESTMNRITVWGETRTF